MSENSFVAQQKSIKYLMPPTLHINIILTQTQTYIHGVYRVINLLTRASNHTKAHKYKGREDSFLVNIDSDNL